jgi:hypothetical protein
MNSPFDIPKFDIRDPIYHSQNDGEYFFTEIKKDRIYFSIPNRKYPNKPYTKSITKDQFDKLLNLLEQNKELATGNFPFRDCRIAAFFGFVNVLNPNRAIKERGKIKLINSKNEQTGTNSIELR